MKQFLRLLIHIILITIVLGPTVSYEAGKIRLGIWTGRRPNLRPGSNDLNNFCTEIDSVLGLNLIVGRATPDRFPALRDHELTAVGQNVGQGEYPPIPELYARQSSYSIWRATGQPYDAIGHQLTYKGGVVDGSSLHFRASIDSSGVIQTRPNIMQIPKYFYPDWNASDPQVIYTSEWVIRGGKDREVLRNDTVATLVVVLQGNPEDTLETLTVMDSDLRSGDSDFDTLAVDYNLGDEPTHGGYSRHFVEYRIDWKGNRDIWVNSVIVYDQYGKTLHDNPAAVKAQIEQYYSQFSADNIEDVVIQWHIAEEIGAHKADQLIPIRIVDSLLETMSPAIESYTLITEPSLVEYLDLDVVDIEPYPFHGDACGLTPVAFRSSGECGDSISLQQAWDENLIPSFTYWTNWAKANRKRVSADIQSFRDARIDAEARPLGDVWRRPTARELLCNVNLALAYDIRQLHLWSYGSGLYTDACKYNDGGTRAIVGLIDELPYIHGFSVEKDARNRTATYYAIADTVAPQINRLSPHLEPLDWVGSCRWDHVRDSSFSNLDSVLSLDYAYDSVYAQLGFFRDSSLETDYLFVVNRRCLPSETQRLRLFLREPETSAVPQVGVPGRVLVDAVSGDTLLEVGRSNRQFEVNVEPGSAKLIRIRSVPTRSTSGND